MLTYSILIANLAANTRRMLHMDSEDLLTRAYQLDEEALVELHEEFYPVVYRFVRFRLEDEQLVEDITSDVFLHFLNALSQERMSIRDVRGWLLGTASNLIYDQLRRKYRHPIEDLERHEDLPDELHPETIVENDMANQLVRQCVKELTEDQQKVLSLRFSQGMSVGETARIVHKSVNAVKVLQYRALSTLRRMLASKKDLL